MVAIISSLGRSGVSDWLIQRVTAVIMLAYTLCMLSFFLVNPDLDFGTWKELFQGTGMRIFSLLAMLSIAAHAWIGIWTVSTDYIKCPLMRTLLHVVVVLALFSYTVWAIQVLWGA